MIQFDSYFFQMGWNHQPEKNVHELHHSCDFAYILGLNFESFLGYPGEFGTLFSWVEDVHVDINIWRS